MTYLSSTPIRAGLVLCVAALAGVLIATSSYDKIGGPLFVVLAFSVLVLILVRKLIVEGDRSGLLQILVLGLVAKLTFALVRYVVTFILFGAKDASGYNTTGAKVAESLLNLDFAAVTSRMDPGTSFAGVVTGFVYALIGPTVIGGFLVFSFLAFMGAYFFLKAFQVAFPGANWRLFAILVFFEPTVLYWPTGLGKDALVFFFGGVFALGAAYVLAKGRWSGFFLLTLGVAGTFYVRPEAALVLAAALAPAVLLTSTRRAYVSLPGVVLSGIVVVGGLWFILGGASALGLGNLTPSSALDFIANQAKTDYDATGSGSNFSPASPGNPLWVPLAFITVLLRPFPWEANSLQVLLQSLEGPLLAGILLWNARNIGHSLRSGWKQPYLFFALVGVIFLVLGLSTIGNFGLLARQRALVFPFLFVLICYRTAKARKRIAPPLHPAPLLSNGK